MNLDIFDLICLIIGICCTPLCVYLLYLHDWNLEDTLFGVYQDDEN